MTTKDTSGPRPRIKEERAQRRRRTGLRDDSRLALSVPETAKDKDFEYRWVNDDGRRVQALNESDDWDFVTSADIKADERNVKEGAERISRVVGRTEQGAGMRAYLMRKPKDYYQEDKAAEQAAIDETEAAMRQGVAPGSGALTGPHAYVPAGGIRIDSRDHS